MPWLFFIPLINLQIKQIHLILQGSVALKVLSVFFNDQVNL